MIADDRVNRQKMKVVDNRAAQDLFDLTAADNAIGNPTRLGLISIHHHSYILCDI